MEIVDIYDEYMSDPEFKHIKTGTIRAKLKFNAAQNVKYYEIVKKIPKNTYIQGNPVSIERVGEPRCRFCQSTEHKVMQCKIKGLKCDKCNGRGHTASNCNLAKRITKSNADHSFDDGEGIENSVLEELNSQLNTNTSTYKKDQIGHNINYFTGNYRYYSENCQQATPNSPINPMPPPSKTQIASPSPQLQPLTSNILKNALAQSTPQPSHAFRFPEENNSTRGSKRGMDLSGSESKKSPENPKSKNRPGRKKKKNTKESNLNENQLEKEASRLLNLSSSNLSLQAQAN